MSEETSSRQSRKPSVYQRWHSLALAAIILASSAAAFFAMTRTSTTWDEIVLMAGGARGWQTGDWDLAPEHPPLMQYLYGLPLHVAHVKLPAPIVSVAPESAADALGSSPYMNVRYDYARRLIWRSGNNPVLITTLARSVGILFFVGLVLVVYTSVRPFGTPIALSAALLVAFSPEVLGHSGTAYFDVPLAFAVVLALLVLERVVRAPSLIGGGILGLTLALAMGIKITGALLVPVCLVVVLLEGVTRPVDLTWRRQLARAALSASMVAYLALVLIYRGDFALEQFRYAVEFALRLGVDGHEFGTVLLGEVHRTPPIWAYPVVLFFKTPLAFWLLLLTAIVVLGLRATESTRRMLLSSRLRAPLVAIVIMGSTLVWSNASVASRYAIPLLVLLATVVAAGIGVLWTTASRPIRGGLAAALLVHVASALSFYPNFLAYVNEAGPDSNEAYKLFTSGNVDLGQGLLELKRWMREHDQEYVYLAYHGVGDPAGYGIRYVPLRSWFPLADDAWPAPDSIPKYAAISTHWLVDESASSPFASYRGQEPAAVVGHVFLIFETKGRPPLGLLEMNRASMTEESPQGRGHRVPAL